VIPNQTQTILLETGWNIFSTGFNPKDQNLDHIFSNLIQKDQLVVVQDEEGNSFERHQDKWINNIGKFNTTQGYKVQVKSNIDLEIIGHPVNLPLNIQL